MLCRICTEDKVKRCKVSKKDLDEDLPKSTIIFPPLDPKKIDNKEVNILITHTMCKIIQPEYEFDIIADQIPEERIIKEERMCKMKQPSSDDDNNSNVSGILRAIKYAKNINPIEKRCSVQETLSDDDEKFDINNIEMCKMEPPSSDEIDEESDESDCEDGRKESKKKYKGLLENGYKSIEFSVDLVKATSITLNVLDYLYDTNQFADSIFVEYSFIRYRQFLLLKAKEEEYQKKEGKEFELVPPPDVQVLWATHLIRQQKYRNVFFLILNY